MKKLFTSIFKIKRFRTGNIRRLFIALVLIGMMVSGHLGFAKNTSSKSQLKPNSLAWQMEELVQWLMKTRNLVPQGADTGPPFYVIESLELSGSVEKNRFTFSMKGSVLSDKPVLVPMFGPPERILLSRLTLNGQPAVVGFEGKDYYFVQTRQKNFQIKGELSLLNELSFTVQGPVNLFTSDFSDGRVVEGTRLPGLSRTVLHFETGKRNKAMETQHAPLFQISRAIRIQKEVTFEYQVKVRSGTEISTVEIPMKHSEIVLEVPGIKGWKMEKGSLVVPASGKSVSFTVRGRLPGMGVFKTDTRSNYEWWLIESDVEHRVEVKTNGKYVDASRSPLKKELSSSRLFLLSGGQEIVVTVKPLRTLDAMAVVIHSQFRKAVWTKNGDLMVEDRVSYDNNGVDYISFDCQGKPIYFADDDGAKAILSENPEEKNNILVPLQKGKHSFFVESIKHAKPSLLGGMLNIPTASHNLTVSRSSVRLGLPSDIIPIWFFGGERIAGPVNWKNVMVVAFTLGFVLLFFKDYKLRTGAFISFIGLYLLLPGVYLFLAFCVFAGFLFRFLKGKLKGWTQWAALGILILAGVWLALYLSSFFQLVELRDSMTSLSTSGSGGIGAIAHGLSLPEQDEFEIQHGAWGDQYFRRTLSSDRMEGNMMQGVVPVYLPMPEYRHSMTVTGELVTKERPLNPALLYVTWYTLIPFILFWLFCWGYMGFRFRRKLNEWLNYIRINTIKKKEDQKEGAAVK